MPLQSYHGNVLSTAHQVVVITSKFSVDVAAGKVTPIEGKRVGVAAGVGTGVITITLPQIFRNVVSIQSYIPDSALAGLQLIPTSDVTVTADKTKSQFTATLTKLTSGAPAALTTGVYTVGIEVIAAA